MDREKFHRRAEQVGIGSTAIAIIFLFVLVIGLWQNWINIRGINTDTEEAREIGFSITLNTEEIAEDARTAEETAGALTELSTVKGKVLDVNLERSTVELLSSGDHKLTLLVEASTDVYSVDDQPVRLDAISKNDEITVVYKTNDRDMNVAQKIRKLEAKNSSDPNAKTEPAE